MKLIVCKFVVFSVFFYLSIFCSSKTIDNKFVVQNSLHNKADSVFNLYFQTLEKFLQLKGSPNYSLKVDSLESASGIAPHDIIIFFQNITGIKAPNTANESSYVWFYDITDLDVKKWKDWHKKNRYLLVWENDKKRVNRKDKDIYSGNLKPN